MYSRKPQNIRLLLFLTSGLLGFDLEINSMFKKIIPFIFMLFTTGTLTACGRTQSTKEKEPERSEIVSEEEKTWNSTNRGTEESLIPEKNETEPSGTEDLEKRFGGNCIIEQTFEVELSEYNGKVYFVPFAPSEDHQDLHIQIIQDSKTLADIPSYVPDELAEEKFSSLDAVTFYDINYDGSTDILLIETYGSTSFAAVYYGFDADAEDYERQFISQEQLSENITKQAKPLSIPEIRSFLSNGKKNGEFSSYQEAYETVSRLYELEDTAEKGYNLIYFDANDIPELVAGVNGYYTSLYTYNNGTVYTLMDRWPYGAMGNAGYEYSPGKNSLRNYNNDFAGAILYTTYMTVSSEYSMDIVAQIETYNFDDVNKNKIPDENEAGSIGHYSVSYINGAEAADEECASYDAGNYEYMEAVMSLEELKSRLN